MSMVYIIIVYNPEHFILSQRGRWYLGRILEDYKVSVIKTVILEQIPFLGMQEN